MDEGIVPLVTALSLFPRLRTIDSCQDDGVTFVYGRSITEAAQFFAWFSRELSMLMENVYLTATWRTGSFMMNLRVSPPALDKIGRFVTALADAFDPASCSRDSEHRGSDSCPEWVIHPRYPGGCDPLAILPPCPMWRDRTTGILDAAHHCET